MGGITSAAMDFFARRASGVADASAARLESAASKVSAVAPRVYFFHGVDTKGMADHGRAALEKLADRFQQEGFPEAKALSYNTDNFWLNQLAIPREQIFHTFSNRLSDQIVDDLAKRPLAPGQKISLVGYSLGTKVAADVAENLGDRKIPVDTLALIEPKNGNTPQALKSFPKVGKVVMVENQTGLKFNNPYQDTFVSTQIPNKNHFQMVENPDEKMIQFLLAQLKP